MSARLAADVLARAQAAGRTVALAESCTGGLIAAALTDHAGASAVLTHGVVAYANEAKSALLGVPPALIAAEGAVSRAVALAMAEGALRVSGADVALSVTGIAGPGGGTRDKPVGLVWFGLARPGAPARAERRVFAHRARPVVRQQAVATALRLILSAL